MSHAIMNTQLTVYNMENLWSKYFGNLFIFLNVKFGMIKIVRKFQKCLNFLNIKTTSIKVNISTIFPPSFLPNSVINFTLIRNDNLKSI